MFVSQVQPGTAAHSLEAFLAKHVADILLSRGEQRFRIDEDEAFHLHPGNDKHLSSNCWRWHCSVHNVYEGTEQEVLVPLVTVSQEAAAKPANAAAHSTASHLK